MRQGHISRLGVPHRRRDAESAESWKSRKLQGSKQVLDSVGVRSDRVRVSLNSYTFDLQKMQKIWPTLL